MNAVTDLLLLSVINIAEGYALLFRQLNIADYFVGQAEVSNGAVSVNHRFA